LADDEGRKEDIPRLGLKDYVALTIAAMETFLLPLIILAVVLAAFAIFFTLRP
jgi:hypothetical protein